VFNCLEDLHCMSNEISLPYTSLDNPISQKPSETPGYILYRCGKCLYFVRVCTSAVTTTLHNFRVHQESEKCKAAYRSGVWDLTALLDQPRTGLISSTSVVHAHSSCPGIPLVWPGDQFYNTYPWHLHDVDSTIHLPWRLCSYHEQKKIFFIRAQGCDMIGIDGVSPCNRCTAVADSVRSKALSMSSESAASANYIHWSRQQLADRLLVLQSRLRAQKLELATLQARVESATNKALEHQPLLALLSNHNIPRLPAIVTQSVRRKESVSALTQRLVAVTRGICSTQSNYSQREHAIALLALRLGGYRLLFALQHEYGAPSLRTVMRQRIQTFIRVSISVPSFHDIVGNLRELVIKPRSLKTSSRIGCQISLDETALRPSACYVPHLHSLGGLCSCNGLRDHDLVIHSEHTLHELARQVLSDDEQSAQAHFASQATVVALNFLGQEDYRATPFIVSGCCGAKDAQDFVKRMILIIKAYEESGAQRQFGWFFSFATDGDLARRKGGFCLLTSQELNRHSQLGQLIYPLVGMNCMVGPHNITLDFDWKHIIKREQGCCL
jgi:hypothetical protein